MRLVTWNCCRGPRAAKLARIAALGGDVVALQEIGGDPSDALWLGPNRLQGLTVVSSPAYPLTPIPIEGASGDYALPVRVGGVVPFTLIAVWAQPIGDSYVLSLQRMLDAYEEHLRQGPVVFMGDLNAGAPWDRKRPSPKNYSHFAARLAELGLVSAYHAHFSEAPGQETRPTHFFRWKRESSFHLDYCFLPQAWMSRVTAVEVGGYEAWADCSDHRPLVVDLELRA